MTEVIINNADLENIRFFAQCDTSFDKAGKKIIGSAMPAYCNEVEVDKLKNDIGKMERKLNSGTVASEARIKVEQDLKEMQSRLADIEESRPKLTGVLKEKMKKVYDELSKNIKDSMFSNDKLEQGRVDTYQEYKRQTHPCVDMPRGLAMALNVRPDGKRSAMMKVSRNEAGRCFQVLGHILNENIDTSEL